MKTMSEIIEDVKMEFPKCRPREGLEICMMRFALQALDLAAEEVLLKEDDKDPYKDLGLPEHQQGCYGDGRDGNILVWIDKQSILKLKDQLK